MDSVTIIVLGILFVVLAWFAILIFSEKNSRETPRETSTEDDSGIPPLDSPPDELGMYHQLMGEYAIMLKKLRKKIQAMEEPSITPINEQNITNLDLLEKIQGDTHINPETDTLVPPTIPPYDSLGNTTEKLADIQIENVTLKRDLTEFEMRTKRLEDEVDTLKKTINHYEEQLGRYRDMVRGSQGNFTIINKHNYRLCSKNPESGELEYRLIKLPPDFNPFNPSHITPEGIEIFEDHNLEIPTRLGDIIRKEYSHEDPGDYTAPYWPKAPETHETDEPIKWEIKQNKH